MNLPRVSHSSRSILLYSHYSIVRLSYEESLLDQHASAVAARDRFKAAMEAREVARLATTAVRAGRNYQDSRLDNTLRDLEFVIRARCGFDRTAVPYSIYFPNGLTGIVRVQLVRELRLVVSILNLLATEEDTEISAFEPRLRQAYDEAVAARNASVVAEDHERAVSATLVKEKTVLIESFRQIHLELYKRLGKNRADFFFKGAKKPAKSSAGDTDTTATEDVGAGAVSATPVLNDTTTSTDSAA